MVVAHGSWPTYCMADFGSLALSQSQPKRCGKHKQQVAHNVICEMEGQGWTNVVSVDGAARKSPSTNVAMLMNVDQSPVLLQAPCSAHLLLD